MLAGLLLIVFIILSLIMLLDEFVVAAGVGVALRSCRAR